MSDFELLKTIKGYSEALAAKQALERSGSGFQEVKGAVRNAVVQLHPKRLPLVVSAIIDDTPSTKTLRVKAADGHRLPPFQAGQYINVFVDIDGVATARPYAISSSPLERDFYDLTVKRAEGGYVSHYLLDRVAPGERLLSSGPMGSFHYNPIFHGQDLVFIAGGSGSAPARSMLLNILERDQPLHFHMIYANSYSDDVIYAEQLRALAAEHANFTLDELISRPEPGYSGRSGRISSELLQTLLGPNLDGKMFYLCGPTPFNEACLAQLLALGVKRRRIRIEANGAPKAPQLNADWPAGVNVDDEVTIAVKGRGSFKARVGEPLLNSLERNGYSAENACRSGECSLCRIKLLSGAVHNPPEAHLRKSDRDFGWIYACVAFPTEDIEVLL
ncbi:FAD-binding oxidoreductase [Atopomonas sediminilitoris]|uniref:FAD-binding oxidoreductase n=1 Tax=Atopomonas sediminilitoris TaxID=2919919 RepID=UPI001F4E427A|nr:FAD-binding oxidoreductase [Atopomonas sediminilitoris]MCJ8170636.1 FAD-binding oxidoreductase [Atopomonas sediminilitoris]